MSKSIFCTSKKKNPTIFFLCSCCRGKVNLSIKCLTADTVASAEKDFESNNVRDDIALQQCKKNKTHLLSTHLEKMHNANLLCEGEAEVIFKVPC